MQDPRSSMAGHDLRRLVLGTALAAGLVLALLPEAGSVRAATPPARTAVAADITAAAPPKDHAAPSAAREGAVANPPAAQAAPAAAADAKSPDAEAADTDAGNADDEAADKGASKGRVTVERHGIVIDKGDKHIRIEGLGRDREYDSFEQFVQQAPWLAGLVFVVVLLVFLVPLLIIVLLVWYKIRKSRLAHETMLKLAERGVVTPAAAMDAVASGNAAALAAAASAPATNPAYEQARLLHRRIVWSDLRKGIILTGVGLGLTFYSMLDDGTPNSIGLILLFVGVGYCLLWFFEDRTRDPHRDTPAAPPPGGA